jgi:Rps23 Pro-64 3,4-dihydroxylase Tpa1-like proline 4-hydroxylase
MSNENESVTNFAGMKKEGHYDFSEIRKENDALIIHGKSVGQNPDTFERSQIYKQNFEKMGNGVENIKVIENFISEKECTILIDLINKFGEAEVIPVQWDSDFNPTITRKTYSNLRIADKYVPMVQNILEKEYGFPVQNKSAFFARWDEGDKLDLHVDDLGPTNYNHMATLIYLNDNYEGGEIEFPTHNFSHKPKTGDLIMFPGNMYYSHEVKTIVSGIRWTIPMWFEFV